MLGELSRSYLTIVKDLSRVMNRLKAEYRSWAIPCAGPRCLLASVSSKVAEQDLGSRVRFRAERLYQQLDILQHLR
jgi:hypothetical protein